MSFATDLPEFKSFQDTEDYWYNTMPSSFWSGVQGLIRASSKDACVLKNNLNRIAEIIPCEPTNDWGWDFLENQICWYVRELKKKVEKKDRIDVLMDYLAELVVHDEDRVVKLNEFLEEQKIGYKCSTLSRGFNSKEIKWECREKQDAVETLAETKKVFEQSAFQQAYEEYTRAKVMWKDTTDSRTRKDIVRSCINAMESIVKICAGEKEIKNATDKLKRDGRWGNDYFIKQGLSIFNKIHELYPDLRHGATETSKMTIEEAGYWVGVISVYIQYMKKMADKNGIN